MCQMSLLLAGDRKKWFEWIRTVTSASGSNTFLKFSGEEWGGGENVMNVDVESGGVHWLSPGPSQQPLQALLPAAEPPGVRVAHRRQMCHTVAM